MVPMRDTKISLTSATTLKIASKIISSFSALSSVTSNALVKLSNTLANRLMSDINPFLLKTFVNAVLTAFNVFTIEEKIRLKPLAKVVMALITPSACSKGSFTSSVASPNSSVASVAVLK